MFSRRRDRGKQTPTPANPALDPLVRDLAGTEMPKSLDPKLDPKRTAVFDDEIDPVWRDPNTSE